MLKSNRLLKILIAIFLLICSNIYALENGMQTKAFKLKSVDPKTLVSVLQGVKSPEGNVIFGSRTNQLIVIDTPEKIKAIEKVIKEIDVMPQQVKLQVRVVDISNTSISGAMLGARISKKQLSFVLGELQSKAEERIIHESMIVTLSNHSARIKVASDVDVGKRITIYDSERIIESPILDTIGSTLEVLPRVNRSGKVVVSVDSFVSNVKSGDTFPTRSTLITNAVISDGDTIIIGGSSSSSSKESSSTFSSGSENRESEIVALLTVNVLK